MACDDLTARKTELEDRIDSLSSWMIGFTWPVAIGLIMEFYAVFNPSWTAQWNVTIDRIGLLLVTAGVSGELVIEHRTHVAERRLRRITSDIERESDELIAELNAETARANLELLRLKTPRVIPPEQEQLLSNLMRGLAGQEFELYSFSDEESRNLTAAIERILMGAGWIFTKASQGDIRLGQYGVTTHFGVHIQIASSRVSTQIHFITAQVLASNLKALAIDGIEPQINQNPEMETTPDRIHVIIGKKMP